MSAYRRLAKMTELQQLADFKSESLDRFGPLPLEAQNLLLKIMLKALNLKRKIWTIPTIFGTWFGQITHRKERRKGKESGLNPGIIGAEPPPPPDVAPPIKFPITIPVPLILPEC